MVLRMAQYRTIARARAECITSGKCNINDPVLKNILLYPSISRPHSPSPSLFYPNHPLLSLPNHPLLSLSHSHSHSPSPFLLLYLHTPLLDVCVRIYYACIKYVLGVYAFLRMYLSVTVIIFKGRGRGAL
jgi:hypothetical protein